MVNSKIRKVESADIEAITSIHIASFPRGILTFLGKKFLANLYEMLRKNAKIGLVAEGESGILGYVFSSATIPLSKLLRMSILPSVIASLLLNLPRLIPLIKSRLDLALKSRFFNHKVKLNIEAIELSYIAVDQSIRSKGLGAELIESFEFSAQKNFDIYIYTTRTHNERLTNYYLKSKNAKIIDMVKNKKDYSCNIHWEKKRLI